MRRRRRRRRRRRKRRKRRRRNDKIICDGYDGDDETMIMTMDD